MGRGQKRVRFLHVHRISGSSDGSTKVPRRNLTPQNHPASSCLRASVVNLQSARLTQGLPHAHQLGFQGGNFSFQCRQTCFGFGRERQRDRHFERLACALDSGSARQLLRRGLVTNDRFDPLRPGSLGSAEKAVNVASGRPARRPDFGRPRLSLRRRPASSMLRPGS